MKKIVLMLLVLVLIGCATKKIEYVSVRDTILVTRSDTINKILHFYDSVQVVDSVFVFQTDSMKVKEIWRTRTQIITKHDTINHFTNASKTIANTETHRSKNVKTNDPVWLVLIFTVVIIILGMWMSVSWRKWRVL